MWVLGELLGYVAVIAAAAFVLFGVAEATSRPGHLRALLGRAKQVKIWHLGVAIFLLALVLGGPFPIYGNAITLGIAVVLLWFAWTWLREFVYLMSLRDDDFPGRNDKLIWVVVLFAVFPVGVWAFRSYRLAHWPEPAPERESDASPVGGTHPEPAAS